MESSHHQRVRSLFDQALEVPAAGRVRFVTERAGADSQLCRDVLELLQFAADDAEHPDLSPVTPGPVDAVAFVAALPAATSGYEILSMLGHGAMGVVCRARQEATGHEVALKILFPRASRLSPSTRFQREIAALRKLDHPGIARLLDIGTLQTPDGPCPYLAMEYVDGRPLRQYVAAQACTLAERIEILATLCEITAHAHAHGVVHRDLKPDNILVRKNGSPVLLDFGLAQLDAGETGASNPAATRTGQLIGTVTYMSPEQARGATTEIGPWSDLYSLGVLGFELLTGELPYDIPQHNVPAAIVVINTAVPRLAGTIRAELRGDVELLLARALDKIPAGRIESAARFATALRDAARALTGHRSHRLTRTRNTIRRRNGLFAAGVASALVAAVIAWLWITTEIIGQVEGSLPAPVTVRIEDPSTGKVVRLVTAGQSGNFTARGLPAGIELTVCVRSGLGFAARRLVPLRRGRSREVTLSFVKLPPGIASDSLVAWWPGDGNFTDIAGAHDGRATGPVGFVAGASGQAFRFDGSEAGFVLLPQDQAFRAYSTFTVEAWVRPDYRSHAAANQFDNVFSQELGCTQTGLTVTLDVYKTDHFGVVQMSMPQRDGTQVTVGSGQTVLQDDNRFHHVAGTYDGSVMRVYIDGRECGSWENPNPTAHSAGRARMGRHGDCISTSAIEVDELRYFARALDDTEILALHAAAGAARDSLPPHRVDSKTRN